MGTNHLINVKRSVIIKDSKVLTKPADDKTKSQLVKVTSAEIDAIRPSVYNYLLP